MHLKKRAKDHHRDTSAEALGNVSHPSSLCRVVGMATYPRSVGPGPLPDDDHGHRQHPVSQAVRQESDGPGLLLTLSMRVGPVLATD